MKVYNKYINWSLHHVVQYYKSIIVPIIPVLILAVNFFFYQLSKSNHSTLGQVLSHSKLLFKHNYPHADVVTYVYK